MINQKFMKLCTLQDPNMKMCILVGYPGPLSSTPVTLYQNVVERTDDEDSESERESEMSSSECEMSKEETFRSINRIIEYSDRICDSVVK